MNRRVPLDADGFKRIDAEDLLLYHREATIVRGDIVRAIATLTETVRALEKRIGDLEVAEPCPHCGFTGPYDGHVCEPES